MVENNVMTIVARYLMIIAMIVVFHPKLTIISLSPRYSSAP
jgi:hypothetical protein